VPRDLIVLLDTSGSMSGEPLEQAKAVVRALIGRLDDADRLELIEFSTKPRRWKRGAVPATARARAEAIAWVDQLEASGATEMVSGILAALHATREGAQRQVILVTDGLIGFEERVVGEILRKLPPATRVHTVGVGSSVNRSLTAAAARAGRGVEVLIGVGEDAAPAIERLLARTSQPLVTELEISGPALQGHAPAALPDLFGGAPALVALRLRPEGGSLVVRGRRRGGVWEERLDVPATEAGSGCAAVPSLYARERVEDLEAIVAAGKGSGVDAEIERLGLAFQIATRLTSWVAISEEPTVDAGQPVRRERIPHELAQGISAEGVGLRSVASACMALRLPSRSMMGVSECRMPPDAFQARATPAEPRSMSASFRRYRTSSLRERELVGRIVLRRGRELVIEIDLHEPLQWQPEAIATLALSDGTEQPAELDAARTTAAGEGKPGQTLRITLLTAEAFPAEALREVWLECADLLLHIRLEA
jgi:Ca-activated chloride channel family protein